MPPGRLLPAHSAVPYEQITEEVVRGPNGQIVRQYVTRSPVGAPQMLATQIGRFPFSPTFNPILPFPFDDGMDDIEMIITFEDEPQMLGNPLGMGAQHPALIFPHALRGRNPQEMVERILATLERMGIQFGEDRPAGLDRNNLSKLTRGAFKKRPTRSGEEEKCTICLVEFEDGETVNQLPCQHIFHVNCIENWLLRTATCPVCKKVIEV